MEWTKESALAELKKLIESINSLKEQQAGSADHVRWNLSVRGLLQDIFGMDSVHYRTFISFSWERDGKFIVGGPNDPEGSFNPQAAIEREHHRAYLEQLESTRGILLAAQDKIKREDLKKLYQGKNTGPETSIIFKIIFLAENKLRKVAREKPRDEKQVQDFFESLLLGADIIYSREKERIEYSSKTYTPDFSIPKADLVVEIKFCDRKGREKEMIAEINDDILAYKQKYGNLVFVIYDLGLIRDMDAFSKHFEVNEGVMIKIVKH